MKLTLTIEVDEQMITNQRDAARLINWVALDVHQSRTGGFILNPATGKENGRWQVELEKK